MRRWEKGLEGPVPLALLAVIAGTVLRGLMARVMFLQADEEIFGYNAFYIIMGRPFDFIVERIGAYLGYPLLLSVWYRIFGVSLFSARLFSVLCSALFILFIYLALLRLTNKPRYAFLGSLLIAVTPFPLRYGHIALSEPLAWVFLSASFFLLVLGLKGGRWYMFALSGLFSAPAVFVRRSALIMVFIVVPALVWTNRSSFKVMLKETGSWLGGFLLPVASTVGGLILYFGWDGLNELRWTRVPNLTADWKLGPYGITTSEDFLYAAQPVIWKGLILFILAAVAGGVLLMALHRNRWKAVYAGAVLWPLLAAVAFNRELSDLTLARMTVIPVIVLFMTGKMKRSFRFYAALSLLFGSAVAFSTVPIQGDLWNVIMYMSVGAVVLVYLEDRFDSPFVTPLFMIGGLAVLIYIMEREPRIEELVSVLLPISAMTFSIGATISTRAERGIPLFLSGALVPLIWFRWVEDPLIVLTCLVVIPVSLLVILAARKGRGWGYAAFLLPFSALAFSLNIPDSVPLWGIYLPVIGCLLFMVSAFFGSNLLFKADHLIPITGAVMAFLIVILDSGSVLLAMIALVMVGSFSTVMRQLDTLSIIWRRMVDEKVSVLLFLMVAGYLAFYVYYSWTEVYYTEFLLQAGILGGLLLWVIRERTGTVRTERAKGRTTRIVRPIRIRRRVSILFLIFIVISVPVSVAAYLDTDWFEEEPMDRRPYMRTIMEISDWIEENSDEEEKILAWHCYALQARRETIIEVSNAQVYDGYEVVSDMKSDNVSLFVRCWYTDHGIWRGQPYFQEYIRENFVIDRVVDGNECWIRK